MELFKDQNRNQYFSLEVDLLIWFTTDLQEKKCSGFIIIDKPIIQIGNQNFWLWICMYWTVYRSVVDIYISQEKNKIFVAGILYDLFYPNMVSIQFTLMVVRRILYKHAIFYLLKHMLHSPLHKSLIERVMSISRILQDLLMITTILVTTLKIQIVIYIILQIGSIYSFICIMEKLERNFYPIYWRQNNLNLTSMKILLYASYLFYPV